MSLKEKIQKSKFISYFDLRDSFQQPGCPICALVEKQSYRFLDGLLYERVNDTGTREGLRKSYGFCNWHAWKSLEASNCALGLGIIYEDILNRVEKRLEDIHEQLPRHFGIPFLRRLFKAKKGGKQKVFLRPIHPCPACQNVASFEKVYLETLLDYIFEPDFERQFILSSGICFAHLSVAINRFPRHKNLQALIKMQIEKFERLRKEVSEFVRKQDYNFRDETWGAESNSWKRALEMVAGKREIFGSHMERLPIGSEESMPPSIPQEALAEEKSLTPNEVIEGLKFENEKLRRKIEELQEEHKK